MAASSNPDDLRVLHAVMGTDARQNLVIFRDKGCFRLRFDAPVDNIMFVEVADVRLGPHAYMHNIDSTNNVLHASVWWLPPSGAAAGQATEKELYTTLPAGRYADLGQLTDALQAGISASSDAHGLPDGALRVQFDRSTRTVALVSAYWFRVHAHSSTILGVLGMAPDQGHGTEARQTDGGATYTLTGGGSAALPLAANQHLVLRIPELEPHLYTTPLACPGAALLTLDAQEARELALGVSDVAPMLKAHVFPLVTRQGYTTVVGRVDRLTFAFSHTNGSAADLAGAGVQVVLKVGFLCPRPNTSLALGQLNPHIARQGGAAAFLKNRYEVGRYE